ncbi:response regulator [Microvirgula aerodenitrificans]|uniref:response regulator n=1 Tax=Microvirgula aerodenitrificans TaxID=57480 RepID=UPI00248D4583|nr:response regulator [Microvirgula aerodenitrificans]
MRILLVEDDAMIGKAVKAGLEHAGFAVDWVQDGRAAALALTQPVYDLMLLDLGLPQQDGMSVLLGARRQGNKLPVLVVTARDAVADRIAGLNAGADDYVLKPFDLDELIARIQAVHRRHAGNADSAIRHGALTLDLVGKTVRLHDQPVALSAREYALLAALMQRPGAVLSREKLEESIYGWGDEIGSNVIEVYLHHLRKKLGPDIIVNVRGVGYRVAEV